MLCLTALLSIGGERGNPPTSENALLKRRARACSLRGTARDRFPSHYGQAEQARKSSELIKKSPTRSKFGDEKGYKGPFRGTTPILFLTAAGCASGNVRACKARLRSRRGISAAARVRKRARLQSAPTEPPRDIHSRARPETCALAKRAYGENKKEHSFGCDNGHHTG